MKFEQLKQAGMAMDAKQIDHAILSLAADPRFPAVIALAAQHRESYVTGGSQQRMAGSHGNLAHNAGSIFALDTLCDAIRGRVEMKKKGSGQKPWEETG